MLKLDLKYRKNTYYNDTDYFICDNTLNGFLITKLEYSKGFWWTVSSLQFKVDTIKVINSNEILGKKIKLKDLDYHGKISKFLSPTLKKNVNSNIGVVWNSGPQIKKLGLAPFWIEIKNLEIKSL